MTFLCRSILLCALAFFSCSHLFAQTAPPGPAPASMVVGAIKAANVRGTVKKVNLIDKTETPLRNGEVLIQENAILTGPGDSSVVLVFANGSTVRVGNESRLEIKEFLMDPLTADIPNVAALTAEPTVSRTNLRLEFGEMVGNVKTLNRAAGSAFTVSTPAGAAGIRGTTFRIVYRPTGDGLAFNFSLSTSEGVVLFEGTTLDGLAAVNVPLGQE
ncbi:MAG: FecR domain-containing protein, partial [Opitutaceae bacterium]